jgi:hypothetical protein
VRSWIVLLSCAGLWGCGGLDPSRGLQADLRVSGGQFHEGSPSVAPGDAGAPATGDSDASADALPTVVSVNTKNLVVWPGQAGKSLQVLTSPQARTVAAWLDHDEGYWVVPVADESIDNRPDLELSMLVDFSPNAALGVRKLWFAAADEHGRFGPAIYLPYHFVDQVPDGDLVIRLTWEQNMDLDLIVVDPDGSTLSPAGYVDAEGAAISSGADGGTPYYYFDSNSDCRIDGDRRENAVYPSAPPSGTYRVYVRLNRSCGVDETGWTVDVYRHGKKIASRRGQTFGFQVDTPHGGPDGPGMFVTDVIIGH